MPTIIDRYTETVVFYPLRAGNAKGVNTKTKKPKKQIPIDPYNLDLGTKEIGNKFYNRKNPRSAKLIKSLIRYTYETSKRNQQNVLFVTISTKQHESGLSDRQLWRGLHLWLKNQHVEYICVAERQNGGKKLSTITREYGGVKRTFPQATEDLHFHLIIRKSKDYEFGVELRRLSKLFKVKLSQSGFDVKRLKSLNKVRSYITKYFVKKGTASSLFFCRTWSVSKRLRKSFVSDMQRHVLRLSDDYILNNYHLFKKLLKKDGTPFETEYFQLYLYSIELFNHALKWKREFTKAGFIPINII